MDGGREEEIVQLHGRFVLFTACCCTEARVSQAIVIDSFGISEGMCSVGETGVLAHMCKCAFPC